MKKWILFLVLAAIGAGLYSNKDIFRTNDTLAFVNTPEELQRAAQVYVFTNSPKVVEYKNGHLYGDGNEGTLVANGMNTIKFPKKYRHADVFVIVDGTCYHNSLVIDKEDINDAYDIELSLGQIDGKYYISGIAAHDGGPYVTFTNHPMHVFKDGFEITYLR